MKTILHAIIDPLCGWCYAAEPLLVIAAEGLDFDIKLHGGGLLTGTNRRRIDASWRAMALPADKRLGELSGQHFGDAYQNKLLFDESIVLDSEPTITALLTVQSLGGNDLAMLMAMQKTYYINGQNISDPEVLTHVASELGHRNEIFKNAFQLHKGERTLKHIKASRTLLGKVGGQGFPTMFLEQKTGVFNTLVHSNYYGEASKWIDYLKAQL